LPPILCFSSHFDFGWEIVKGTRELWIKTLTLPGLHFLGCVLWFCNQLGIKASERCTSLFRKVLIHCAWFVPGDLQIKEVCNTEHVPVSVKVDSLQFRPNLVLPGSLPNDEDNWQTASICNLQLNWRLTMSNGYMQGMEDYCQSGPKWVLRDA
jgi:hypothetical protein